MTFGALSNMAALALLMSVAGLVLLLYLLKPRIALAIVPSIMLWSELALVQRKSSRWRWLLSWLLASSVALIIALALTKPELPGLSAVSHRQVLVLDDSPSMAARTTDGKTRWRRAVSAAHAVVERVGSGSEVMILDTMGAARRQGFVSRDLALQGIDQLAPLPYGRARFPPVAASNETQVHLFSDGVADLENPRNTIEHSVFEAADNVAVTAFEARALPNDPLRYQALVQILNASPQAKTLSLIVSGDADFRVERELEIPGGESIDEIIDVTPYPAGVLRAEVRARGDAFDLDNVAFALVRPHHRKRVLLVTEGNAPLEDSLRSLAGVALAKATPSSYRPSTQFDAYVFDRFAPMQPPAAGALLFAPPFVSWLDPLSQRLESPAITSWDETHPLSAGVAWGNVRVRQAAVRKTSGVVNAGSNSALVSVGKAASPWIQVGFALQDSNFPLQPGFPVFLGAALNWLTRDYDSVSRDLGAIEVPMLDAKVSNRLGHPIAATHALGRTIFQAVSPDVFTIDGAGTQVRVVVNSLDPDYAQINRSRYANEASIHTANATSRAGWKAQPWVVLLVLGALLLLVEWFTFTRRVTV